MKRTLTIGAARPPTATRLGRGPVLVASAQRWQFAVGDIVRITASSAVVILFGDADVEATTTTGVQIGAVAQSGGGPWDYAIESEDERYLSVLGVGGGARAAAWVIGRAPVRVDP